MGFFDKSKKEIKKIRILGIRTSEQTKVFSTENSTMYSLVVLYTDNTKALIECGSKEFVKKYLDYIEL